PAVGHTGTVTRDVYSLSLHDALPISLLIRPYMERLSRSELFAVMTVGLATIAGTVLVLYASIIASVVPGSLGQIVTASLISVPADRKSTRLNSSHVKISYAVFCLKKK